MRKLYFNPGCALSIYKPELAAKIFTWLNESDGFKFPDYHGAEMSIQDPCPVRNNPKVHKAVRGLRDDVHARMRERAESMPCDEKYVSRH